MSRKEKARLNKKHIMDTALTLFNKYGFDNVSVNQIIDESNSSKGAFYGHFKSKSYIYIEKFNEIHEFYLEVVKKLSSIKDPSDKLMKFIKEQMSFLQNQLGVDIVTTIYKYDLEFTGDSVLSDKNRPNFEILNNYILEGQSMGLISKDFSSEDLTFLLRKVLRGVVYEWCAANGKTGLIEDTEKAVSMFLTLISINTNKNI